MKITIGQIKIELNYDDDEKRFFDLTVKIPLGNEARFCINVKVDENTPQQPVFLSAYIWKGV